MGPAGIDRTRNKTCWSRWNRAKPETPMVEARFMDHDLLVERFFETLIAGDRQGTKALVTQAQRAGFEIPAT